MKMTMNVPQIKLLFPICFWVKEFEFKSKYKKTPLIKDNTKLPTYRKMIFLKSTAKNANMKNPIVEMKNGFLMNKLILFPNFILC